MKRRTFLKQIVSTAAFCMTGVPLLRAENAGKPPNIIFILTDDQGWTSVSYRSDPMIPDSKSDYIETPQMARAAKAGMRFTDAYAPNAQCSPTRHSILFGQNAARHIYGKDLNWVERAPSWLTIPKALKKADPAYRAAFFGKWHIGVMPEAAGFDFSDGTTANSQGDIQNGKYKDTSGVSKKLDKYNAKHGITTPTLNGRYSKLPVFYSDDDPKGAVSMTRRAEAFIRESIVDKKPFFAYIAHFATHLDLVSNKETYEYFRTKTRGAKHDNPGYASMAKDMDTAIGNVLDLVKELGIQDNTYIFIMSDNGGVQHFQQSATLTTTNDIVETHETSVVWRNLPLKHGKHEYYEGGIRVPFLVLGPGIKPNSVCRVPVTGLDLLPTFAELAGHTTGFPGNIDGGSFVSLLHNAGKGKIRRSRDALFFHQAAKRVPISAIRKGNYKLVKHWLAERSGDGPNSKYRGDKTLELYDLSRDIEESNDLSEKMPELTNALHRELMAFLNQANAETEYTNRWDAFSRMKKQQGIDFKKTQTIEPGYTSPFGHK
jgi:arylsulfatase A-like enzyme